MSELDRYQDNLIERRMPLLDEYPPQEEEAGSNILASVKRRWYIVLIVFLLIVLPGIPAIWLYTKPMYTAVSKLRIAHMMEHPLTGEDDPGGISSYRSFVNTQVGIILGSEVVQKVAGNLANENLEFFSGDPVGLKDVIKQKLKNDSGSKPDVTTILTQAIYRGDIAAVPERDSYLLQVMTRSANPDDAQKITDEFVSAYYHQEVLATRNDRESKLQLCREERARLSEKMEFYRKARDEEASKYGSRDLTSRQDVMLEATMSALLTERTRVEARRISLDAQLEFLKSSGGHSVPPADMMNMRKGAINSDPTVTGLITAIIQMEQELIGAEQKYTPTNPVLAEKRQTLEIFRGRLQEAKKQAGQEFDEMIAENTKQEKEQKFKAIEDELGQVQVLLKRLDDILNREKNDVKELGNTQLRIEALQFQLDLVQKDYNTIVERINELEWESKGPDRIRLLDKAQIARIDDKRTKLSAALAFGAMALGMFLALLRDKADVKLRTPEDVAKTIGVRIIGTTTSTKQVKKALLPQQVAEDYQTIHANLGLIDHHGMPKTVVIASPGMQEGKTTFSINLATSIARSGKKVLLIDGDLRKPDIGPLLGIPRGSRGLQNLIWSRNGEQVVYSIPDMNLDVLTADARNQSDAYELLALPHTAECIKAISTNYDHVIIDTPPVLAFADALLWARMADAAILTSFAGKTTAPDLKETKEKLSELGIRILGTVLTNVHTDYSYYRYGHSYYSQNRDAGSGGRTRRRRMLLLPVDGSGDNGRSS